MKTSTLILLAVGFYLYSQQAHASTGTNASAPTPPQPVPQSGGGSSYNDVLNLIKSVSDTVGKGLDYATKRSA